MLNTAMIPLESVLTDVHLMINNESIKEDFVMENAIRALEHLSVYKTYDFAVCLLRVENNQVTFPNGMLGIEHVLYLKDASEYSERRFILQQAVTDIVDVSWHAVEYNVRYEAKVTNFVGLPRHFESHGWAYLPLSDRNFDKSVLCNPELQTCGSCGDWWYPDTVRDRFITSFESGYIAVTYYRYPQNEEGQFLIMDQPDVKQAIYTYVMTKIFERQWLNNVEGAERKYQHFNRQWGVYYAAAIAALIKPSLPEIINGDRMNTLFKKDNIQKLIGGYGKERKNMR